MISSTYIISGITLLIVGLAILLKRNEKIQAIVNLLFTLLTIQLLQGGIAPEENSILATGILGSFIGLNLAFALLFKNKVWRWAFPAISTIVLFIVGKNELQFEGYSISFNDTKIVGLIVLGLAIGLIASLINKLLTSFFKGEDNSKLHTTAQVVLTGLFLIPATFFASWYGILLLAIGYFIYNSFTKTKNDAFLITLLAIASISFFIRNYSLEGVDLTIGKVIAGLFIGAGSYYLTSLATKSLNNIIALIFIVLGFLTVGLITILNNIHPAYGGVESFIAGFLAMALINTSSKTPYAANILFPAFLTVGMLLPSDPFAGTESNETTTSTTTNQEANEVKVEEPKGIAAEALNGKYTIDSETANLEFQMGPKGGVTKGAITNFEGTVDFGTAIETAKFNVKLSTKKLTTFNSMRDESVMGDKYLNAIKFPIMSFKSSKTEKKEDGYTLIGEFTLLGKTKPEEVFIKYLGESNGKQQFTGKAAIDRTKYGMAPSPQEGNVVDFTFKIELK